MFCLSLTAYSQNFEVGGISYNILSTIDHTVEVASKSCNYYQGNINIPATVEYDGATYDVVALGEYAFYGGSLSSVSIPLSVTHIKYGCFLFATLPASISVPASVTRIDELAFAAYRTPSIVVDENNPCYRTIDGILFSKDTSTLVECPMGKSGLVSLPSNTKHVAPSAFAYCQALTGVSLPDGLSSIGYSAFIFADRLNNVVIPSSVSHLGTNLFGGCSALSNLQVAIDNSHYYMDEMMIFSMGGDTLVSCHKSDDSVFLPLSLRVVGGFGGNKNIKYVHLPDGVETLSESAFNGSSLVSIDMPDNMESIEPNAFNYCKSLTHVAMPRTLVHLGYSAFEECNHLDSITIPDGIRLIPNSAFYFCTSLKNIEWGNTVETIDTFAFGGCGFTDIQFPSSLHSIRYYAFCDYDNGIHLNKVVFSAPVDTIEDAAFMSHTIGTLRLKNTQVPASTDGGSLYGANIDTIVIPCGSLSAYLADDYWRQFADKYLEDCNIIESPADSPVVVYPNPAIDRLTVETLPGCHRIDLVNALGQTVLSQPATGGTAELDLRGLARGTYFLLLHTPHTVLTTKVVLQ